MSEYEYITAFGYKPPQTRDGIIREAIVRCVDCKFCVKRGYRMYCGLNAGGFPEVVSDGFCAWAERRE